jgi:hypothetical protein
MQEKDAPGPSLTRRKAPRQPLTRRKTDAPKAIYAGPALAPVAVGGRLGIGLLQDGQAVAVGLTGLTVKDAASGRGGMTPPWPVAHSGVILNPQSALNQVLIGPPLALRMTKRRARDCAPLLGMARVGTPPDGSLEAIDLLKANIEDYHYLVALAGLVGAVVVFNPAALSHMLSSVGLG